MEGTKALSVAGLLLIWLARIMNCQIWTGMTDSDDICSFLDQYKVDDDFEDVYISCYGRKENPEPGKPRSVPFRQFTDIVNDGMFDKSNCVMFVVADWNTEDNDTKIQNLISGYLHPNSVNVCQLLWSSITVGRPYEESAVLASQLGPLLGDVMSQARDAGLPCYHTTGHGLGAQLLGSMCRTMETKCERMITLDPSALLYEDPLNCLPALNNNDATCVRVYHTDAGGIGIRNAAGTVDFWSNGGSRPQPGCHDDVPPPWGTGDEDCSHNRALDLCQEAITNKSTVQGVLCSSWEAFEAGECDGNPLADLNSCQEDTIHGSYYFKTSDTMPYGEGIEGTMP